MWKRTVDNEHFASIATKLDVPIDPGCCGWVSVDGWGTGGREFGLKPEKNRS